MRDEGEFRSETSGLIANLASSIVGNLQNGNGMKCSGMPPAKEQSQYLHEKPVCVAMPSCQTAVNINQREDDVDPQNLRTGENNTDVDGMTLQVPACRQIAWNLMSSVLYDSSIYKDVVYLG